MVSTALAAAGFAGAALTDLRAGAPVAEADGLPPTPTGTDPWLETVNWWRSLGGALDGTPIPPLVNDASRNVGPQNQASYLASVWSQGSTYCGHGAAPGFPKDSKLNYQHWVLDCYSPTLTRAVETWMNTPYHGLPLLGPELTWIGGGSATAAGRTASAAVTGGSAPIDRTYLWPANGGVLPRLAMQVYESPDPTELCPPESGDFPGQPVFAWFPTNRTYVSSSLSDELGPIPSCEINHAGDGSMRAAILLPRRFFRAGATVTATVTTTAPDGSDRQTVTWTFTALDLANVSVGRLTTTPSSSVSSGFVAVTPRRLLDTREAGQPFARMRGGQTYTLDLRSAMPRDADAVALNLTSVDTAGSGWVRAWACSAAVPETANLTPQPGPPLANAAIVPLGDGRVCFQSLTDTDLVVDLNGWLTRSSTVGMVPSESGRLLDTRQPGASARRLAAGATISLQVVAPNTGTTAVALNVTAVDPGADGYITVWPCSAARPLAASLNPVAGVTRPNLVNVQVGADGKVCVYTMSPTDLVVDMTAEYRPGAGSRYLAIAPTRALDTRTQPYTPRPGISAMVNAAGAIALQANVTAVGASSAGFLTAYPCMTEGWPGTANVNFGRGTPSGNAAVLPITEDTSCLYANVATHSVIDVFGIWTGG